MENKYIEVLLGLAKKAYKKDETPIAALIVYNDRVIAKSFNKRNKKKQTTSHAEIEVINIANKKLKDWRLNKCTMYVTVKPCPMCEKVIKEARIDQVYYLVERDYRKTQYEKTKFNILDEISEKKQIIEYKDLLANFWKNKR